MWRWRVLALISSYGLWTCANTYTPTPFTEVGHWKMSAWEYGLSTGALLQLSVSFKACADNG